jgi:hypothetical protein
MRVVQKPSTNVSEEVTKFTFMIEEQTYTSKYYSLGSSNPMETGTTFTALLFIYMKTIAGSPRKTLLKVRLKLCKYLLEQMDCLSVFA